MSASRSFSRRVILWFTGATLVLVAGGIAGYFGVRSLTEQNSRIAHMLDTREVLGTLVSDLRQMAGYQRDYVITDSYELLTPYLASLSLVRGDLKALRDLLGDNPAQSVRLRTLEPLVERRMNTIERNLEIYRTKGRQAAFDAIAASAHDADMVKIQEIADKMSVAERDLLRHRMANAAQTGRVAFIAGSICIILCFGIFSFVFWLIRREGIRRAETEAYLQQAIEEKERANTSTSRINKIADFLQSCRTPTEAFQLISQQMPALLPGTSGAIGVNNSTHNLIEIVLTWGDDIGCAGEFLPDECWALRRGRMHVIESAGLDPVCEHVTAQHLVSICMPMMAHGEAIGMLYVTSNEHHEFAEEMLNLVRTVSEQAALALANLKLQETLRIQSIRDPLTQLFNRRYMEASLERELSRAKRSDQPLSVLMVDIDHFKKFNDTYGHEAGDLLLGEFGRVVTRHVRSEDIACRYGGEEFVMIIPGADPGVARQRAEDLCSATRAINLQYNRKPLGRVTISVGYATFPDTSADPAKLINAADMALYRAKSSGRDRIVAADEHIAGEAASHIDA